MRHVILNFHGLGAPDQRPLEPGEDRYWIDAQVLRDTIDLSQQMRDKVDVKFTFDDGNLSDFTIGAPLLNAAGISAQFFVLADRIDQPGSLSTAQIRELVAQGHQIGSHGAAHVNWKTADLDRELGSDTRQKIADAAGTPITQAAIPFGAYNGRVVRALRDAGYTQCYSSDGGAYDKSQYPIPRTSIRADMTMDDIKAIILGHEPAKTRVRRALAHFIKKRV